MIFQGSFKLEIDSQNVYAVFDFDTGLLGFVRKGEEEEELTFLQSPVEYRKAFIEKLIPLMSSSIHTNWKICRKNPKVRDITALLHTL